MIIDITNELLTEIDTALDGIASVSASYQSNVASFPYVTFTELSNNTNDATIDTSGETHNDLSFEVTIYTTGHSKVTSAKIIRGIVDTILSGKGMSRNFANEVPNFLDSNIYKYVMRYSCTVNQSKLISRR